MTTSTDLELSMALCIYSMSYNVACHASTKTALQLCSLANHRHRAPSKGNSMLPHCLSAPLSPMHRSSPCVRRPQSHDQ